MSNYVPPGLLRIRAQKDRLQAATGRRTSGEHWPRNPEREAAELARWKMARHRRWWLNTDGSYTPLPGKVLPL